jgi:hypothetical protein
MHRLVGLRRVIYADGNRGKTSPRNHDPRRYGTALGAGCRLRGVCGGAGDTSPGAVLDGATISKRKGVNLSKPWKCSQKRFFALRIKLENDGRSIGGELAADGVTHF